MGSVPILCVSFNVTIDTIKLEANTDEKFRNFLSISLLPVNLTFDVPYSFKVGIFGQMIIIILTTQYAKDDFGGLGQQRFGSLNSSGILLRSDEPPV